MRISPVQAYIIALLVLFGTFFLRLELRPVLNSAFSYTFFYIATLVVCFYTGVGPSLFILVPGALLANYSFVAPYGEFTPLGPDDYQDLVQYFLSGALTLAIIEWLQRARYETQLLLKVSESRYDLYLDRENSQLKVARQLQNALREIALRQSETLGSIWLMVSVDGDYLINFPQFASVGLPAIASVNWRDALPIAWRGSLAVAVERSMATGQTLTVELPLSGASGLWRALRCVRNGEERNFVVHVTDAP